MKTNSIIAIVIGVVVIAVAFMYFNQGKVTGNNETITSQGTSVITAQADEVVVYIDVSTLADTAVDSKDKNAIISDKLIEDLKLVAGEKSIETTNYNVYEEYDYTNQGRNSKGFRTENSLKLSTKDFDLVGKLVDLAIEDGARVSYINFELSEDKRNEFKKDALAKAAEDAKLKAEATASGLGKRLGKIVSVTTNSYDYMPYRFLEASSASESVQVKADTQIIPSNLDISANVNVVFDIK